MQDPAGPAPAPARSGAAREAAVADGIDERGWVRGGDPAGLVGAGVDGHDRVCVAPVHEQHLVPLAEGDAGGLVFQHGIGEREPGPARRLPDRAPRRGGVEHAVDHVAVDVDGRRHGEHRDPPKERATGPRAQHDTQPPGVDEHLVVALRPAAHEVPDHDGPRDDDATGRERVRDSSAGELDRPVDEAPRVVVGDEIDHGRRQ